jgi:hypothetical protein
MYNPPRLTCAHFKNSIIHIQLPPVTCSSVCSQELSTFLHPVSFNLLPLK